jgi:sarcosine oxidase subunit gamma
MIDILMTAQSAFAGIDVSTVSHGIAVTEREGSSIASLSVRRGRRAALQERMAAHFGIALPDGPRRVSVGAVSAAGIGPGSWLLICENGGNSWIADLKSAVGETASVVDQSDAYGVLRLTGPALRETLAKLVPLDLHPRVFREGDVAGTLLAHIGASLWRCEDGADGHPAFELAVPRSLAASVWHELSHHAPVPVYSP